MDCLSKEDLKELLSPCGEHCISLYMPTNRAPVEGRQDLIRFKNMLRETEEWLIRWGLRPPEAKEYLAPLVRLHDDLGFWQYRGDGLALFYVRDMIRHFRLPVRFDELLVVANRFHLKPLIPLFAEDAGFYVLALSQNSIRLIQGNQCGAWEVELEDVPASLTEYLRYDDPERQLQFRGKTPIGTGGRRFAVFFAHGVGLDDSKDDIARYFQQIGKGLKEVLGQRQAPLILAGVDYLMSIYRGVNSYPHLLGEGIVGNPELLSPEELHARAWKLVQPRFLKAREEAISRYKQLAGTGRTSREIKDILPAASLGRVERLVVAQGVQVWGSFLPDQGSVELHGEPKAGSEDLLDRAAIEALLNGGKVYTAEPQALPDNASAIALFRY
jgi:hypothetical protein